jgi:hypothetical protein
MSEEHDEQIKVTITEHIGIFENAISPKLCEWLINYFEFRQNIVMTRSHWKAVDKSVMIGDQTHFLENNNSLIFNDDDFPNAWDDFSHIFWEHCYPKYIEAYPFNILMAQTAFGYLKIQKTPPGGGYHTFHFENDSIRMSKRVMFVIAYLNDIEEGGETEFLYQKLRVQPKAGTIVIAPAYYTHTHRGNPPLKQDKYILTSWIEYVR